MKKYFENDSRTWLLIIGIHILVVNVLSGYALTFYPNTGDEFSILFQAEIFSKFKLTAVAPSTPGPYLSHYMDAVDGRWFSQYPPVYSLMLLPGVLIGQTLLYVSLLSGLTVFLLCSLLKRIFGEEYREEILLFCLFFSFCPTYLFHAASYYNHIGALLVFTLALHTFFRYLESEKLNDLLLTSALVGVGFGIRPYTFFLLSIPLLIELLLQRKIPAGVGAKIKSLLPVTAIVAMLIAYNYNQTGQWDEISYLKAGDNSTKLSLREIGPDSWQRLSGMISNTGKWLFSTGFFKSPVLKEYDPGDINLGAFLLILSSAFLGYAAFVGERSRSMSSAFKRVAFFSVTILIFGHLFYRFRGGRFDERFFFEVTWLILFGFFLFLRELRTRFANPKVKSIIHLIPGLIFIPSLFLYLPATAKWFRESNLNRMNIYIQAETMNLRNAVIYVSYAPGFDRAFYVRNHPDLSGNIFIGFDEKHFPETYVTYADREKYLYLFDHGKNEGVLVPVRPDDSSK